MDTPRYHPISLADASRYIRRDLADEQRKSAVLLAPLNAGGGSKLKVLESMAAGLGVAAAPVKRMN